MLTSITEGALSDMKLQEATTSPNLYLPAALASVAALVIMVYYHHMEVWSQPTMTALTFMYWVLALGCEVFRLYRWLGHPDHMDVRIMRFDCFVITVVIYATFLIVECVAMIIQVRQN